MACADCTSQCCTACGATRGRCDRLQVVKTLQTAPAGWSWKPFTGHPGASLRRPERRKRELFPYFTSGTDLLDFTTRASSLNCYLDFRACWPHAAAGPLFDRVLYLKVNKVYRGGVPVWYIEHAVVNALAQLAFALYRSTTVFQILGMCLGLYSGACQSLFSSVRGGSNNFTMEENICFKKHF